MTRTTNSTSPEFEEDLRSESSDDSFATDTPQDVLDALAACGSDLTTFASLFASWKLAYCIDKPRFNELSRLFEEAILKNNINIVRHMLQEGYTINVFEVKHAVALHRFDLVDMLLREGWWDINRPQSVLKPPILGHLSGDEVCARWLLEHGADPNARGGINDTCLSLAVTFASIPTILLLFDYGGDITQGELLHHALWRRDEKMLEVVTLLLDRGVPINRNMYEDDELGYKVYLPCSRTPLHDAAIMNRVDVLKLLIERGADVHKLDNIREGRPGGKGQTALESAAWLKSWDAYDYLLQFVPVVEVDGKHVWCIG